MKLSKREKILIAIFFIVVLTYAVYKFVPIKSAFNLRKIQDEHQTVLSDYETMSQNIKMKKFYEDKEQELLIEINDLNVLSEMNQEQIIEMLNNQLSECNIKANNISFSEGVPDHIKNDSEVVEENKNTIVSMSVNIEFTSNYNDMLSFIDKLQNNSYDISITNIHVLKGEENIVNCVMDINFYAMKCEETVNDKKVSK